MLVVGGWSGPSKDVEEKTWKPNMEAVSATIHYAVSTGRLNNQQKEAEEGVTKGSDSSDGGGASDTNDEA